MDDDDDDEIILSVVMGTTILVAAVEALNVGGIGGGLLKSFEILIVT